MLHLQDLGADVVEVVPVHRGLQRLGAGHGHAGGAEGPDLVGVVGGEADGADAEVLLNCVRGGVSEGHAM